MCALRAVPGAWLLGLLLLLPLLGGCGRGGHHAETLPTGAAVPSGEGQRVEGGADEVLEEHECLVCHGFRENEEGAPYVDGHGYLAAVHAKNDVACSVCHENQEDYPHSEGEAILAVGCGDCHDDKLEAEGDDVHVPLAGRDAEDPATSLACVGCHDPHTQRMACAGCHDADWKTNPQRRELGPPHDDLVFHHGEKNRWCLDCHDETDRRSFRLANGSLVPTTESHRLCGQCHGDKYRDWRAGVHGRRVGEWPSGGEKVYRLCVQCHDPHSPRFKPIVPEPAPVRPEDLR